MSIGLAGVEVYIEDEEEGRGRVEGLEQEGETTSERRSANDEGDYERKVWDKDREVRRKERKSATKSTRGRKGSSNSNLDVAG